MIKMCIMVSLDVPLIFLKAISDLFVKTPVEELCFMYGIGFQLNIYIYIYSTDINVPNCVYINLCTYMVTLAVYVFIMQALSGL